MPVITALRRLRQEEHEFKSSLGYLARSCLKKQKTILKKERKKPKSRWQNMNFLWTETVSIACPILSPVQCLTHMRYLVSIK
jgi:hypothetical protein